MYKGYLKGKKIIFEIYPEDGKKYRNLFLKCDTFLCEKEFFRKQGQYLKMKSDERYIGVGDVCVSCARKIMILTRQEEIQKAAKKGCLDKKEEISEKRKESDQRCRERMSSGLNPMKNKDVAEKAKASRKKYFSDPENRLKVSKQVAQSWKDGKYENVSVGKCKWFEYRGYKVQGKWELSFLKYLIENKMKFSCHKGRIKYLDIHENERSYYPDFFIYDWNCYVDVKNKYHFNLNENKFNLIEKYNPEIKIKILFKEDLLNLGVNFEK